MVFAYYLTSIHPIDSVSSMPCYKQDYKQLNIIMSCDTLYSVCRTLLMASLEQHIEEKYPQYLDMEEGQTFEEIGEAI